jgi:hypothetical protein
MSLYDDDELDGGVGNWTSGGMKLLQSHVQLRTKVNQLAGLVSNSPRNSTRSHLPRGLLWGLGGVLKRKNEE